MVNKHGRRNRQTSGESASLPQYDEGTESAEVATSDGRRRVGLKTGRRKTGRADFDTFLDITFLLLELFL
jgi:hypothetical protein